MPFSLRLHSTCFPYCVPLYLQVKSCCRRCWRHRSIFSQQQLFTERRAVYFFSVGKISIDDANSVDNSSKIKNILSRECNLVYFLQVKSCCRRCWHRERLMCSTARSWRRSRVASATPPSSTSSRYLSTSLSLALSLARSLSLSRSLTRSLSLVRARFPRSREASSCRKSASSCRKRGEFVS